MLLDWLSKWTFVYKFSVSSKIGKSENGNNFIFVIWYYSFFYRSFYIGRKSFVIFIQFSVLFLYLFFGKLSMQVWKFTIFRFEVYYFFILRVWWFRRIVHNFYFYLRDRMRLQSSLNLSLVWISYIFLAKWLKTLPIILV
jgi:hypothetical protein